MKDFEVHDIGTAKELRLSRELSESIHQLIVQFGEGIIPNPVLIRYKELIACHKEQLEREKYVG